MQTKIGALFFVEVNMEDGDVNIIIILFYEGEVGDNVEPNMLPGLMSLEVYDLLHC